MAERLASALRELPRAERGFDGTLTVFSPLHFVSVPWGALPEQRPSDNEEQTVYISQDTPTVRNPRTGMESGTVVLALPAEMHLPRYGERWIPPAQKAGMLIGDRGALGGRRLSVGHRERVIMDDGTLYDLHRVTVEEARPEIPIITESNLSSDGEAWITYLVEQIEHGASRTRRYGSDFLFVRDARLTMRDVLSAEEVDGHGVTRTLTATGQANISPMDKFEHLDEFIITPVVNDWLNGTGIGDSIAPGLGRATAIEVKVNPAGRGIADVTITASFVSLTQ